LKEIYQLEEKRYYYHEDRNQLLNDWSETCAPFLKLSRQLRMPSNPEVRYLTFICLVVLQVRSSNSPSVERKARAIQARIKDEFVDQGNGQQLDTRSMALRLARIVEEQAPYWVRNAEHVH